MSSIEPQDQITSEFRVTGRNFPWAIGVPLVVGLVVLALLGKIPLPWGEPSYAEKTLARNDLVAENNAFGSLADRARAATAWSKLRLSLDATAKQAADARQRREDYAVRLGELRESEHGRRLASQPELVAAFVAVGEMPLPPAEQFQQLGDTAKRYVSLAKAAEENEQIIVGPDQTVLTDIEQLSAELQSASEQLTAAEQALAGLMARGEGQAPGEHTLAAATDAFFTQRNQRTLDAVARERDEIRTAAEAERLAAERLAEETIQSAKSERQQAELALKTAEAQARADREKAVVQEAKEKLAAEKAHAEKLRRFEQARGEIDSLLSPMISTGRMQIGASGWTAGEEGPVSLAALKKAKALNLTPEGMITLGALFGGPLNRNERPRGGFPESMPTNETTIRRAQELLVEFGDILVDKGMLKP